MLACLHVIANGILTRLVSIQDTIGDQPCDLEISFQLLAGHHHRRPIVGEPTEPLGIVGQSVRQINVDAEQVRHRVLILRAGQTGERHAPR